MTVERIRKAILSEAHQEAEKIEAEAQQRHDRRLGEARKELEEEFARRFEHARQQQELESRHRVMGVRAKRNLELLERRNAILDEMFRRGAEQIAGLADDEYRALVEQWMAQVPPGQPGEVLCRREDVGRLAPLIEQLNAKRVSEAQLELKAADTPELGGVIFRTEKFVVDLSLDSRLERLRQELAPDVAEIVFPSDLSL